MRSWCKPLGLLTGVLLSLGGLHSSASAQFPPDGGYGSPPPGMGGYGPPPGDMGGPPPGAFGGGGGPPGQMMPAEFPNPAKKSGEPASPFTIRDEGMPNAFTELIDPRPKVLDPYILTFRTEFLNWQVSPGPSPTVLVTTTSNFPAEFGALNQPGTTALAGGSDSTFDYTRINGFRSSMGLAIGYIPPLEVSGFLFNRTATAFSGGSLTNPTQFVAIPFQDVSVFVTPGVGAEDAFPVAAPGAVFGTVSVTSKLNFWGIEANGFFCFAETDVFKMDFILGYRYVQLGETEQINVQAGGTPAIGPSFGGVPEPAGFVVATADTFQARNYFNGAQIGIRTTAGLFDRFTLFSDAKLAVGSMQHTMNINGISTLNEPVAGRPIQTLPGGIFALPSNSGTRTGSDISLIPELTLTLSYQLHPNFRLFGGYDMMYITNVIRPGDAVSGLVDSRQVPVSPTYNPAFASPVPGFPDFIHRNFIAQGFMVGIEIGF